MKILTDSGLLKVFSLLKSNFAAKTDVPSKTSELTNDSGFITGVNWNDITEKPSSFTPASHDQAANTITALTGYSKSVSGGTGALTTSDTLNKALAKLENALDDKQAAGNYLLADAQAEDAAKLGGVAAADYAKLASPEFTGTPIAPTADAGTNTTQIATTAFVQTAVSDLVNSAPETLDTLSELASALGDDPNFATTIATQIGEKIGKNDSYLKTASVSSNTLTITKGDDTTVTFTANNYTHPTTEGNKHIPSGGSSGQILQYSAAGTAAWATVATGETNGTFKIGSTEVAIAGLGSAAYTASTAYAAASHTHPSSDIIALTGYSKSVSDGTGALATSDTLNKALAKLENALDGKQDALTEMTATEVETIWNNAT